MLIWPTASEYQRRLPARLPSGTGCQNRLPMTARPWSRSTSPRSSTGPCPPGQQAVISALKARIETLQAEIERLEAAAAGHRADFERERDRADRLLAEMLKATGDMVAAKEATAWLEGELAALRSRPDASPAEIARVEAIASACRADFERDRAERLAVEVLKAAAETTAAKAATARLESELEAARSGSWWRRIAGTTAPRHTNATNGTTGNRSAA